MRISNVVKMLNTNAYKSLLDFTVNFLSIRIDKVM